MANLASVRAIVSGHVQGVFFRTFVFGWARQLGITGYVRNLPDGEAVAVQAEGERKQLERLISYLKLGPPRARVEKVVTSWSKYTGAYPDFSIRY